MLGNRLARRRSRWKWALLLGIVLVAALATFFFAARAYRSYHRFNVMREHRANDVATIKSWMTLRFVARDYGVSTRGLAERLGLPADTDPNSSLTRLADRKGVPAETYLGEVRQAVTELRQLPPEPPPRQPPPGASGPLGRGGPP